MQFLLFCPGFPSETFPCELKTYLSRRCLACKVTGWVPGVSINFLSSACQGEEIRGDCNLFHPLLATAPPTEELWHMPCFTWRWVHWLIFNRNPKISVPWHATCPNWSPTETSGGPFCLWAVWRFRLFLVWWECNRIPSIFAYLQLFTVPNSFVILLSLVVMVNFLPFPMSDFPKSFLNKKKTFRETHVQGTRQAGDC